MPGPKPVLNPFRDSLEPIDRYIVSCTKTSGYLYDTFPQRAYLCEACATPQHTVRVRGHGFTEGTPIYLNCILCGNSLVKTRPLINCSDCSAAREHVLEQLEEKAIPRQNIKVLIYDTVCREITYLTYMKPPTYELLRGASLSRLLYEQRRNNRHRVVNQ
jgi:hypothetical protein